VCLYSVLINFINKRKEKKKKNKKKKKRKEKASPSSEKRISPPKRGICLFQHCYAMKLVHFLSDTQLWCLGLCFPLLAFTYVYFFLHKKTPTG